MSKKVNKKISKPLSDDKLVAKYASKIAAHSKGKLIGLITAGSVLLGGTATATGILATKYIQAADKINNTVTITFDSNGGTRVNPIESRKGAKIESPTSIKDTYELEGWYTDPEFKEGTKFDFNAPLTGSVTLYAKWVCPTVTEGLDFLPDEDGKGWQVKCTNPDKIPERLTIPSIYKGKPVTGFYYPSNVLRPAPVGPVGPGHLLDGDTLDIAISVDGLIDATNMTDKNDVYGFRYCNKLKEIVIPNTITYIPDYCFEYCYALEKVTIEGVVTSIGDNAFNYCHRLKDINLPEGLMQLGEGCFYGCISLESINLPDSLLYIPYYGFGWCPSLKSVHLGKSISRIESNAFYECYSLEKINLPVSLTDIQSGSFAECSSLTEDGLEIEDGHAPWVYEYQNGTPTEIKSKKELVYYLTYYGNYYYIYREPLVLDEYPYLNIQYSGSEVDEKGKTHYYGSVGYNFNYEGSLLSDIQIPSSVKVSDMGGTYTIEINKIADYGFDCYARKYTPKSVTNIIIPNSVKFIGYSAFKYFPVSSIIFNGTPHLAGIGDFAFYHTGLSSFNSSLLSSCDAVIPEGVVSIGRNAFSDTFISSVQFPSTLSEIASGEFYSYELEYTVESFPFCSSYPTYYSELSYIEVNEDNPYYASDDAGNLYGKKDNKVESLLYCVGEENMYPLEIPEGVTTISDFAFKNYNFLYYASSIKFPSTLTDIGESMYKAKTYALSVSSQLPHFSIDVSDNKNFELDEDYGLLMSADGKTLYTYLAGASSINKVNLSKYKFEEIKAAAFLNATSLQTLILNNGLKTIGVKAFANCSSLTSLELPESVEVLGANCLLNFNYGNDVQLTLNSEWQVNLTAAEVIALGIDYGISKTSEGVEYYPTIATVMIPNNITPKDDSFLVYGNHYSKGEVGETHTIYTFNK